MGLFVEAICDCGYGEVGQASLRFGVGARMVRGPDGRPRFEPHGPDWQPARCGTCRRVVNAGELPARCPTCSAPVSLYSDPALHAFPDGAPGTSRQPNGGVEKDGGRWLLRLRFLCPRCERMDLRFRASPLGNYD